MPVVTQPLDWRQWTTNLLPPSFGGAANTRRAKRIPDCTEHNGRVRAIFVELPAFNRHRDEYFSEEAFRMLQATFMKSPEAGDMIEGTGGLAQTSFRRH